MHFNYLAKFLPHLSQVSEPLRQLTKKNQPFDWDKSHDAAFTQIKKLITEPPVLKYYESTKPLIIQCDASDHGLGAALIQEGKPVAFASRALTHAEKQYAQIEKELLAIVYGTERFHQYTYGRPVTVESDHKPLKVIHQKPLSAAPRRLQKMMMRLHQYDLTIIYKKGSEMLLADAHQGIASTSRRARETVYWPHLNQELKDHISHCITCDTFNSKQPKEPLIPHEIPKRAWAKIGCDIFEFEKKSYLVTVDYYSNFFEVDRLEQLTSLAVVKKLKPHFARFGIPNTLVTDNGPQFISDDFRDFSMKYQFEHITTSPYHHQSNGKAESAVKQAKRIIRTCKSSNDDIYLALLAHRNTPQTTHETSPAQRLFNRRTKTPLPVSEKLLQPKINPQANKRIQQRQQLQKKYHDRGAKELSPLRKGEVVRLQPTRIGEKKWKRGIVVRKAGIRSYEVQCKGYIYTRNRKFIRRSRLPAEFGSDNADEEMSDMSEAEENVSVPTDNDLPQENPQPAHLERNETSTETSSTSKTRSGRLVKKPDRLGIDT